MSKATTPLHGFSFKLTTYLDDCHGYLDFVVKGYSIKKTANAYHIECYQYLPESEGLRMIFDTDVRLQSTQGTTPTPADDGFIEAISKPVIQILSGLMMAN